MRAAPLRSFTFQALLVVAVTAGATLAAGFAAPSAPLLTMGLAGIGLLAALLTMSERLPPLFLLSIGGTLTGYAFLGKGFAYVGVPPLFVGELALGLGLLALLVSLPGVRLTGFQAFLIGFMVLGFLRTLPFLFTYGMNAVRDAALWYYGLFALILSVLMERRHFEIAITWFGRLLPVLVVWLAVTSLFGRFTLPFLPPFPGSPVPIYYVKPGDRGVMLVMAGTFVVLGMYKRRAVRIPDSPMLFWVFWIAGIALVSIMTRGGMLAIAATGLVVFALRPSRRWLKPLAFTLVIGVALVVVNPSIPSGYGGRTISVSQMLTNVTSIFAGKSSSEGDLDTTKEWRLEWWTTIYDYTVHGPYFWTGKGFGINLANDDGFQVLSHGLLRSPHNSHITILARMGVPGMAAWIILQLWFVIQLLRAHAYSRRHGDFFWANLDVWLLAAWLAMMINAAFDVYFEGPQGGIWFWSVIGAGLAAVRLQRETDPPPRQDPDNALMGASVATRQDELQESWRTV